MECLLTGHLQAPRPALHLKGSSTDEWTDPRTRSWAASGAVNRRLQYNTAGSVPTPYTTEPQDKGPSSAFPWGRKCFSEVWHKSLFDVPKLYRGWRQPQRQKQKAQKQYLVASVWLKFDFKDGSRAPLDSPHHHHNHLPVAFPCSPLSLQRSSLLGFLSS